MSLVTIIVIVISVGILIWLFDSFRNRGGRKD
jgi:hypothetical protein